MANARPFCRRDAERVMNLRDTPDAPILHPARLASSLTIANRRPATLPEHLSRSIRNWDLLLAYRRIDQAAKLERVYASARELLASPTRSDTPHRGVTPAGGTLNPSAACRAGEGRHGSIRPAEKESARRITIELPTRTSELDSAGKTVLQRRSNGQCEQPDHPDHEDGECSRGSIVWSIQCCLCVVHDLKLLSP